MSERRLNVPSGIGETLRRERERQRLSLDDIVRRTRIPMRHLEAIEGQDFEGLPGLVFTRNFVRQYAEALQIDPEPLIAALPKLAESMIRLPDPPRKPKGKVEFRVLNFDVAE